MRLGTHVKSLRNPAQRHGRLRSRPHDDANLLGSSLVPPAQLGFIPSWMLELIANRQGGFFLTGLTNLLAVMFRPLSPGPTAPCEIPRCPHTGRFAAALTPLRRQPLDAVPYAARSAAAPQCCPWQCRARPATGPP